MADITLKEYQRETIESLARYCTEVRAAMNEHPGHAAQQAFEALTGRPFIDVPQLPGVPYVCLRVPTGGGKTLIAAHSVGVVAKCLAHMDRPLCLWVTPSTTIRDQTLAALQDRNHPYRIALQDSLGVPIDVLTVEDSLFANQSLKSANAVVIVTTIQSYRIGEEEDRRFYQDNGYLMDHFTALPNWIRSQLEKGEGDHVSLSLANVLKLRGPIVIMDEAHNARTKTSFDALARLGPLAVIEFTATPSQEHAPTKGVYASNVLHAVSALQLKKEGMIKLPVELESRESWLDVLALTVERRQELEHIATAWEQKSGRRIRPIALIQAQPRSKNKETQTVERVKEALVEKLKVPAERIRIATGENDDFGGEDLTQPGCLVEYVITVEKLREGWDCPFAYVLGSVGKVATDTAVEQLLGRILRMPHALPTGVPELDRAYAVVHSEDVAKTAKNLADGLVSRCGFDLESANDVLRIQRRSDGVQYLPLSSIPVTEAPDLSQLPPAVQSKVRFEAKSGTIKVHQPLTRDDAIALRESLSAPVDRTAVETYWQSEREIGTVPKMLDAYAKPFRLPQLAVRDRQRVMRFEPIELDEFSWDLDKCEVTFTEAEFSQRLHIGDRTLVDLSGQGAVRVGGVEEVLNRQRTLFIQDDHWEKGEIVRWLDRELHRAGQNAGLAARESQAWLNRVLEALITDRSVEVPIVVRKRHELLDAIFHRITDHGRKQVRKAAKLLFAGQSERRLETTWDMPFSLAEQEYCPYKAYSGTFSFQKHAFDRIGSMGDEESQCAKKIDDHSNVKRWIRNLEHESAGGFSLPLSPGRFFPDFLAELNDGRVALVEYKGSHLAGQPKELHKEDVGNLWADRSAGKCVFQRVIDRNWHSLEQALNPSAPL